MNSNYRDKIWEMASQITHIPYGKKVLDKFLKDREVDKEKFFVGTVFPDIRYLGSIRREETHKNKPQVEKLRDIKDDFKLGMYAHSMVDYERGRVIEMMGIYEQVDGTQIQRFALKFLEDRVVYDLIDDWDKYRRYLKEPLEEQVEMVGEEIARRWNKILREYFRQKPNWKTVSKFAKQLKGFNLQLIEMIKKEKERLESNNKVMRIIERTYEELF